MRRTMRAVLAAIVAMALMAGQAAYAEVCVEAAEQQALRMRMLQTDLMVAALSCKQHDLYNAFVERFKPQLGAEGKVLKTFFKRVYKADGTAQLDEFVTRLANESSLRGMRNLRKFCEQSEGLFGALAAVQASDVGTFLAVWPDADRHGFAACTQQASIP